MLLWLEAGYGFDRGEAYLFLGQVFLGGSLHPVRQPDLLIRLQSQQKVAAHLMRRLRESVATQFRHLYVEEVPSPHG
jgi:hypothetical protein